MKTYNAIRSKWMRRASALAAVLMLTMSFSGYASARILFQDDATHDIDSEGITLNADDGGDEDVTLQFGNDTTDATITFDDGLSDLIYSGAGMDWSAVDQFRIREHADPEGGASCDFVGELIYDTGSNKLQICTTVGVGALSAWADVDTTGGSADLQTAYDNEAATDREILVSADNNPVEIRASAGGDDLLELHANGGGVLIGFNDLGGTTIDIDSLIVDWDATGAFNLDSTAGISIGAGAASNFTTSSGALTLDGAGGVNIAGNAAEVDVTTTGALDLNSGAFTLDGSTVSIDGTDDSNLTITANDAADKTLTISAANAGVGDGVVSISANDVVIGTDTWDISAAGAASGFTTISASGDITTSGGTFVIGTTSLNETTAANDSGAFLVGTFDEFDNSASTNVQDVLDDIDALIGSNAPNVDTMVFEPEYPNYTLWGDGVNNNGKMEALYDSANREQHYRWTTTKNAQHDYDIRFRYTLPDDFSGNGNMTLRLRNVTNVAADNSVTITVRNDTDNAQCHADGAITASAANTWETVTITGAEIDVGCTNDPGDVIEVIMKLMADDANSGGTDVGTLTFAYTN